VNTASPVGLADLADAFLHLKPDKDARLAIGRALGIESVDATKGWEGEAELPKWTQPTEEPRETRSGQDPAQTPPSADSKLTITVLRTPARRDSIPEIVRRATPLPISREMLHPAPAPLLRPRQCRAFIQDHVGQFVPSEGIDVDAAVEELARLHLRDFPRRLRRSFRRGVIAVFDRGPGMDPFREDVAQMRNAVRRCVGPHLVATRDVSLSPLQSNVTRMARPGATVLLVSDLGIGGLRGTRRSWPEGWLALSSELRRAGLRVVAVVPYGARRWPRHSGIEIAHWDESTSPSAADSAAHVEDLARALSICGRIDAALVRAARRSLFPASDAGLEADFLFSPLLAVSTLRAVVFYDDELHRLRAEIAERPSELERARRFFLEYRTAAGPEDVALEEDVVYFALRKSRGDRNEIERRIATILKTMMQRADDADLARWSSAVVAELPEWTRELDLVELLEAASRVRLGLTSARGRARPFWAVKSWLLPRETTTAGIARDGDAVLVREPPEAGDAFLTVPATSPRVVVVRTPGEAEPAYVRFRKGQPGRIEVQSLPVEIETLDGMRARVSGAPPPRALAPGIDWIRSFAGHSSPITALAFHPAGHILAAAADDGTVRLWRTTRPYAQTINFSEMAKRYERVGRKSAPDRVEEVEGETFPDMMDADLKRALDSLPHDFKMVVLLADIEGFAHKEIAEILDCPRGTVSSRLYRGRKMLGRALREVTSGEVATRSDHIGTVHCLAFSRSGDVLATGGADGNIRIRDGLTGLLQRVITSRRGAVRSIAFDHDGHLVGGHANGSISTWDLSGKLVNTRQLHSGAVETLIFSPNEPVLVSGSSDEVVQLWPHPSGSPSAPIYGATTAAFSADGRLLATNGLGSVIHILYRQTQNPEVATLEGHRDRVVSLAFAPGGRYLASADLQSELRIWDVSNGRCIAVGASSSSPAARPKIAFSPSRNELATTAIGASDDPMSADLWNVDIAPRPQMTYHVSAKVVLLGDSGVGKSALALALTSQEWRPTEATHGRNVWLLDTEEVVEGDRRIIRETMLWDLAGQPAYRLLHQLELDDVSVVLIVVDSRGGIDPLGSVQHWIGALKQADRNEGVKKFLVAARTDVDRPSIGRIEAFTKDYGFDGYFETSAKQRVGIAELRNAVRKAIPWDELPTVVAPEGYERLKSFVMGLKEHGTHLVTMAELSGEFTQANLGSLDPAELETFLGLLHARGYVRRLTFGNFVLLEPALLDAYTSALAVAAAQNPDGFGAIPESIAVGSQNVPFLPEQLSDPGLHRLMLDAAVEELVRRDLATWETTSEGRFLVFPSQVRRELEEPPEQNNVTVTIQIRGRIESIYATVVVRLSHTSAFTRYQSWRNAATFRDADGGKCGIMLVQTGEAEALLLVFFDENAGPETRALFEQYVVGHVRARATAGSVEVKRSVICPNCGTRMTDEVVALRLQSGVDSAMCPTCGFRVPLKESETSDASADVEALEQAAERERELQAFTLSAAAAVRTRPFLRWAQSRSSRKPLVVVIAEIAARGDDEATRLAYASTADKMVGRGFAVTTRLDKWTMTAFETVQSAVEFAVRIVDEAPDSLRVRAAIDAGANETKQHPDATAGLVKLSAALLDATSDKITLSERAKRNLDAASPKKPYPWTEHRDVSLRDWPGTVTVWTRE
jgi:RNA polymerase sigma factor (sigma-70 family)